MQTIKEDIRQNIYSAAQQIFLQTGKMDFSLRQVASAAGISLGNLYHYFRSREDLLFTLLIDGQEERLGHIIRSMEEETGSLNKFRRYGLEYLAYARKHPQEVQLMFLAESVSPLETKVSAAVRQELVERREPLLQTLRQIFLQGIEDGEIQPTLPPDITLIIFTQSLRMLLQQVVVLNLYPESFYLEGLEFLLNGLKA